MLLIWPLELFMLDLGHYIEVHRTLIVAFIQVRLRLIIAPSLCHKALPRVDHSDFAWLTERQLRKSRNPLSFGPVCSLTIAVSNLWFEDHKRDRRAPRSGSPSDYLVLTGRLPQNGIRRSWRMSGRSAASSVALLIPMWTATAR